LGVSRSWYFLREKRQAISAAKDKELYEAIEAIVLDFAGYGYRRVVKELARRGWKVNSISPLSSKVMVRPSNQSLRRELR
jgi:hypothetical protein